MLTVGQVLWFVPHDRRIGYPVEVTVGAVGRKWAVVTNPSGRTHRLDKHTLEADGAGYTSPGQAHLSREAYEDRMVVVDAWRSIGNYLGGNRWNPPVGMTIEKIVAAATLLDAPTSKNAA